MKLETVSPEELEDRGLDWRQQSSTRQFRRQVERQQQEWIEEQGRGRLYQPDNPHKTQALTAQQMGRIQALDWVLAELDPTS